MIDLADAYRRMQEILGVHGVPRASYSIDLSISNHRNGSEPEVAYTVAAHPGGVCLMAWQKPSLDEAFHVFELELRKRFSPPAPPAEDLRVELPETPGQTETAESV